MRHVGNEAVLCRAWQIHQAGVGAFFIRVAGVAGHHVGVHIHRIDRIGDGDDVALAEDVEDVAGIAFRAVGNEDLVG